MSSFDEVTTLPELSDVCRRKFKKLDQAVQQVEDGLARLNAQRNREARLDSNPVNFLTFAKRLAIAEHTIGEVAPRAARALEGTRDLAPLVRGLTNRITKLEATPKTGSSALEGVIREQAADQRKQVERVNRVEKFVDSANRQIGQLAYRMEKQDREKLLSRLGNLEDRLGAFAKVSGGVGVGRGKKIENALDRVLLRMEAMEARLEAIEEVLTLPDSEKWKTTEEVVESIADFEGPIKTHPLRGALHDFVLHTPGPVGGGPVLGYPRWGGREGKEVFIATTKDGDTFRTQDGREILIIDDPCKERQVLVEVDGVLMSEVHAKALQARRDHEKELKAQEHARRQEREKAWQRMSKNLPGADVEPTELW